MLCQSCHGIDGHVILVLIFILAPYMQIFIHILWMFEAIVEESEIHKFLATGHWETLFWNWWTTFPTYFFFFYKAVSLSIFLPVKNWALWGWSFQIQSWYCHLLLMNLWNLVTDVFEQLNSTFPSLLLPFSQHFRDWRRFDINSCPIQSDWTGRIRINFVLNKLIC